MVLKQRPTNQGIRFIIGVCIIAVSIYFFYISLARQNSPELFYLPVVIQPSDYPCTSETVGNFSICIPTGINVSASPNKLEIFSAQMKVRGTIQVMDELPQEGPWRKSLHKPLIKTFLGEVDTIDTYHLMLKILEHRYNPALMGAKVKLIPPWMKNGEQPQIIIPEGSNALLFYTQSQLLGMIFSGHQVIVLTVEGHLEKSLAVGIIHSLRAISPGPQGTE